MQVNILEAKTDLSKLVRLLETGKEERIIIARYGKPVVKMTICQEVPVAKRIGVAKGKLTAQRIWINIMEKSRRCSEALYESVAGYPCFNLGAN